MADKDDWLDAEEAARHFGLPVGTVHRLVEAGVLKAKGTPVRFRRRDLETCLERCRITPGTVAHLNPYPGGASRAGEPPTTITGRPDRRYGRR